MGAWLKSLTPPSWVTSTTALGFLLVVAGAIHYAHVHNDMALMVKLVDMVVPAYVGVKGYQMATNGKKEESHEPPAPVGPSTP